MAEKRTATNHRPKYKVIKSIAHGFAQSFVSMENFEEGEYVMDLLIIEMLKQDKDSLKIDILSARLAPKCLNSNEITTAVNHYCRKFFPRMSAAHGFADCPFENATMSLQFDFLNASACSADAQTVLVPYRCQTEIMDDRGQTHNCCLNEAEVFSLTVWRSLTKITPKYTGSGPRPYHQCENR